VDAERERISKFLSFVLRHEPESIGLRLDSGGWAEVDELIRLANEAGRTLSRELIEAVVAECPKRRFALSPDGRRIRANQGHSINIELGLEPRVPPEVLYHGTASRFLDSIRTEGLHPAGRKLVHLSSDEETAVEVGRRHGKPVVLRILAKESHAAGNRFYLSENGVWMTASVPAAFIEFPS
jgi:putative RNA 2'-phosphotransferase